MSMRLFRDREDMLLDAILYVARAKNDLDGEKRGSKQDYRGHEMFFGGKQKILREEKDESE